MAIELFLNIDFILSSVNLFLIYYVCLTYWVGDIASVETWDLGKRGTYYSFKKRNFFIFVYFLTCCFNQKRFGISSCEQSQHNIVYPIVTVSCTLYVSSTSEIARVYCVLFIHVMVCSIPTLTSDLPWLHLFCHVCVTPSIQKSDLFHLLIFPKV